MKVLALLIALFTAQAWGACDSPLSRTNSSANTVLTAAALNSDFNQILNQLNALPGDCITDGTIEFSKLDSGSFAVPLNALKQGLNVTRSDAATLTVGKGWAAVNGVWTTNSGSVNVDFSCSGCASETASTLYYLKVKTSTVGATFATSDLLIDTTAPNPYGYDDSDNLVLARFYNNNDSDIDQYSIDQWSHSANQFIPQRTGWINDGNWTVDGTSTDPTIPAAIENFMNWRRVGSEIEIYASLWYTAAGSGGSGDYLVTLPASLRFATGVPGAKTWVTAGTTNSNPGAAAGIFGKWTCHNLTNSYYELGGPQVWNATGYRMISMNNNDATEWYWGSGSGICTIGGDDHSYNILGRAKIAGWCDAGTTCSTGG